MNEKQELLEIYENNNKMSDDVWLKEDDVSYCHNFEPDIDWDFIENDFIATIDFIENKKLDFFSALKELEKYLKRWRGYVFEPDYTVQDLVFEYLNNKLDYRLTSNNRLEEDND